MKKMVISFAVLALLISNYAHATTYTFTGVNFTDAHGLHTTDMRVTGTVITSSPIPPGSVDFDISGILTSWSFNDGVQTITSEDGTTALPMTFSTDGQGNATTADIYTLRSPVGSKIGDRDDGIWVRYFATVVFVDGLCAQVTDDVCGGWDLFADGASYGEEAENSGVWVTTEPTIFKDSFED